MNEILNIALPAATAAPGGLAGRCVWLTRPRYQQSELSAALTAQGATVVPLPMFDIERVRANPVLQQRLLNLDQYDFLFFISTNAARMGMDFIEQLWPQMPVAQQYFSVGPSTAEVLESYDLNVHYPRTVMNSEALLALPELADIDGKRALIFRGVGGREILANGLRERGVSVDYAEVYQRRVPDYPASYLRSAVTTAAPDAIVVSSTEALANLCALLSPLWPGLFQTRLFVSSERIEDEARSAGFQQIERMPGATDPVIISSLSRLGPASQEDDHAHD